MAPRRPPMTPKGSGYKKKSKKNGDNDPRPAKILEKVFDCVHGETACRGIPDMRIPISSAGEAGDTMPDARPSLMMAIRSQISRSSSSSLEIMITVPPSSRLNFLMVSRTSFLAPISIPRVGSETMRSLGFRVKAFARQTFCSLPPESSPAYCLVDRHFMASISTYFWAFSARAFSYLQWMVPPQ